ncbi:MarR family transcriptional regulator [Vibrio crassostreae]|nr:hypothetical protein EDB44_11289 [Vibrio crassostreae]TCT82200.1 hypothetical protein EDB43_11289 [Vibrio crassostreae]TCT93184.1 hypothetical protein EDB47_1683 [Vibrio crassostreae]CAK2195157.1 MarR family transcriptional regulator [Vibrio crassostreae]CAK2334199.1 MarR family transcriptional regulator [Vibrio crassostreae]
MDSGNVILIIPTMDKIMTRFSAVQKEILTILTKAFIGGVKEAKSTDVNALVNMNLKKDIHPNNFRTSCKTLEERELIQRRKEEFDWFINIAPDGFEKALEWINESQKY